MTRHRHIEFYGDMFPLSEYFRNVVTLRLCRTPVDYEVTIELGRLPHLTYLTYDNDDYTRQDFSYLPTMSPRTELPPSSLRSITTTYGYDPSYSELLLFIYLLKSSANSLISVDVEFKNNLGYLPEIEMDSLHLPLLRHLGLYNVEYNRGILNRLYSAHSDHLVDLEIYTRHPNDQDTSKRDYALGGDATILTSHLPAMEGVSEEYEVWGFAMQLQRDSVGKLSANSISLIAGDWFLLPEILNANPCLRALSMWGSGYPYWVCVSSTNTSSEPINVLINYFVGGS
jgi:hypothetical protein